MWATGFDFGTGALNRLGVRGTDGLPLKEYWADGPLTYLGVMSHHFPNFFFPRPARRGREQPAVRG